MRCRRPALRLAYPGVARNDPDFFAAVLMNHILGGGTFTSRLFREVREERGLTYGIDSMLVNYEHANSLVIGTSTRAGKGGETLDIIRDVVKTMAEEGPTEAELAAAKKYLIGAYAINNLNSSNSIASTLVELQIDGLGADYFERRADYINAVTLEQTKAVARKLLDTEPAVLVGRAGGSGERRGQLMSPTFAVAFGGGGARGLAHIHVIEALDELGIRPVAISGSSIGAIMGAGMAAGMSGRDIHHYASLHPRPPRGGRQPHVAGAARHTVGGLARRHPHHPVQHRADAEGVPAGRHSRRFR